jgi:hypothetical protein
VKDRTRMNLVRLALLLGGLALLAAPWRDWMQQAGASQEWSEPVAGLLNGIGEAAIIALVLELMVDARLKRRLVQDTIHEVAPRILARLLPEKIFRYIEQQILQASLVRRSWNITYTISPLEHDENYVRLDTESRYEMANVGPRPAVYPAIYEVERPLHANVGPTAITEVTVRNLLLPGGDQNLVFRYPGCAREDEPAVVGDYVSFSKSFEIPVHKTHSATHFVFRSTEHFHVGSIVPFFAKYLVEVTSLRVIYPKDKLRVIVDFPANKISELQPERPANGDDTYVFPEPILPGQGFTVRFPKAEDVTVGAGGTH